jgi:hypothetical protein
VGEGLSATVVEDGAVVLLATSVAALLLRAAGAQRMSRAGGLAAGVGTLLLVAAVGHAMDRSIDPWVTQAGMETRGAFVAGCALATDGGTDCTCAFARITRRRPYDTPGGLSGLARTAMLGMPAEGPTALPPAYREALRACPNPGVRPGS